MNHATGSGGKIAELMPVVCSFLWKSRNEKVFNNIHPNSVVILTRVNNYIWELEATIWEEMENDRQPSNIITMESQKWHKPH